MNHCKRAGHAEISAALLSNVQRRLRISRRPFQVPLHDSDRVSQEPLRSPQAEAPRLSQNISSVHVVAESLRHRGPARHYVGLTAISPICNAGGADAPHLRAYAASSGPKCAPSRRWNNPHHGSLVVCLEACGPARGGSGSPSELHLSSSASSRTNGRASCRIRRCGRGQRRVCGQPNGR